MADLIPTPTPPPTPTPAPEPPTPEPIEPPVEPTPEPLFTGDALVAALGLPTANPPIVQPPDPAPSAPAPVVPPATPATPTPAPAPEPPKKRARKSVISVSLDAPQPSTPAPTYTPPAPQPPPVDADDAYVAGLTNEQKEELREAEKAEAMFPEQYRGRRKQLIAWYRQLDTTAGNLLAEDPNRKLDESDESFKKFIETKPKVRDSHSKAVQRAIAKDEAVTEVQQRMAPKLKQQEQEHLAITRKPRIDQIRSQFIEGAREGIMETDSAVATALKAVKADPTVAADYALENEIANEEIERAADRVAEYCKFIPQYDHKGKIVDPGIEFDQSNSMHTDILKFIDEQGDGFAKMNTPEAAKMKVKDGKQFMPRRQFLAMPPAEQQKYWTFNHQDVVNIMAVDAKIRAESRIKAVEDYNKKMGYVRQPKKVSTPTPNPIPTPPPEPIAPPRVTPSRGRVPGTPEIPANVPPAGDPINVSDTLGYASLPKSSVS